MNESQVFAIAILAPIAFITLMLAVHKIPRLLPPYRQALRDAIDQVPLLTSRPIRRLDIVGRDNDRLFIHVTFADATTFGTDAGPPRSYFVYSIAERTLNAISVADVRPHRFRSSWC
jgi:hypothetical protein